MEKVMLKDSQIREKEMRIDSKEHKKFEQSVNAKKTSLNNVDKQWDKGINEQKIELQCAAT